MGHCLIRDWEDIVGCWKNLRELYCFFSVLMVFPSCCFGGYSDHAMEVLGACTALHLLAA